MAEENSTLAAPSAETRTAPGQLSQQRPASAWGRGGRARGRESGRALGEGARAGAVRGCRRIESVEVEQRGGSGSSSSDGGGGAEAGWALTRALESGDTRSCEATAERPGACAAHGLHAARPPPRRGMPRRSG